MSYHTQDLNREKLARAQDRYGPVNCEHRLLDFIEWAWPVVEPATAFIPGPHLKLIVEHLEAITYGDIRNLLINIPPRHMKSLAVSVFWPVWEWISAPHRRWLFASYAHSLSTRDSLRCRRLIESDWFQQHFGSRFALCGDQNTKDRFENDRGGCRIATSTGGAVTGEGGDRIVVDDPHNVIDRDSDATRLAALEWWDQAMSTRLNDPKTGAKVIVMQRIHQHDLSGHVLQQGGYVHLCLPAQFERARACVTSVGKDWRIEEGELLWPARVGEQELADLKLRLGPDAYAGQFQQSPVPAGGAMFKQEWFRYYEVITEGEEDSEGTQSESSLAQGTEPGRVAPVQPKVEVNSPRSTDRARSDLRSDRGDTPRLYQRQDQRAFVPPSSSSKIHAYVVRGNPLNPDDCHRFAVMDPAGTEATGTNKPCFTVIQVWDVTPRYDMLLVHQYRQQVQAPDAADAAIRIVRDFHCDFIGIEKDGLGLGVVQTVRRSGVTVRPIKARGCKEARAQIAQIRMAGGQIYFPRGAAFLFDLETELLHFPRSEHSDQVDALSHAAMIVSRMGGDANELEATNSPLKASDTRPEEQTGELPPPDEEPWID